jgi:periplasmic protein TonB
MRSGLRAVGALRSEEQGNEEPVALETAVIATGARPGNSAAKRELFTEETQTVLVFERGAVIRLSAAVADGQLLFLTNKKTGKEVVTQVIRKRSFRPTSCYVDLEFTEACPGFWGVNFPQTAPLQPNDSSSAKLSDEGDSNETPVPPAPRPDLEEVARLKGEVAELQTQLNSLTASGQAAQAGGVKDATLNVMAVASPIEAQGTAELAKKQQEEKMLEQLFRQESQQELLQGPTIRVTHTKESSVARKAGRLATAGAFALVVVAGIIAAYRFGLFDPLTARTDVNGPTPSNVSGAAKPEAPSKPLVAPPPPVAPSSESSEPKSSAESGYGTPAPDSGVAPLPAAGPAHMSSEKPEDTAHSSRTEIKRSADHDRAGPAGVSPANTILPPVDHAPAAALENEAYVAAKLVHAVKPVSPPDALRNYITGDVTVDAVVDATGHVKSVAVLSGPPKLRNTAIEEMKQYIYEPARKNGKAVTSHVQASLQFWYEP